MSINRGMDKKDVIYIYIYIFWNITMEYYGILLEYYGIYSAIKRNETVPFAETWMDLETVIESEVS